MFSTLLPYALSKPGRQIFWLVLLLIAGPVIGWIVLQISQYLTNPDAHWMSQTVAMLAAVNTDHLLSQGA